MVLTPSAMIPLGTKAPEFNLPSVGGENVSLSDFDDKKVLVMVFMCNHCPYVIHILDGFIDLVNDYREKDAAFVGINSNDATTHPEDSFEKMQEYAQQYNYPFVYAYDESQEVAKAYKAACTPDFYIFDQERKLVYRGQMDDSRPGGGAEVTGEDLRVAIDAVLEDKPVSDDQKPSTGCNIKWKGSFF
jgi:peroxiredoxin